MNDHSQRDGNTRVISDHPITAAAPSPSLPLIGPRTSCALLGCAIVSMSHWLGATWLALPWIGLPIGAWLVGAGVGVSHLLDSRRRATTAARRLAGETAPSLIQFRAGTDAGMAKATYEVDRQARRQRFVRGDEATNDAPVSHDVKGHTPLVPLGSEDSELTATEEGLPNADTRANDDHADADADAEVAASHAASSENDREHGAETCEPEVVHIPDSSAGESNFVTGSKAWSIGALRFGKRLIENPAAALRNARSIMAEQSPARAPGLEQLRIGLSASAREVDSMMDIAGGEPLQGSKIDWMPVEQDMTERQLLTGHRLDALVYRRRGGELVIVVPEHPTKAAGWPDWSMRMPLSYAGLFPTRVDPSCVSCGGLNLLNERDARLVTRLAEACAVLGRLEPRLSVSKMWDGRAALANMSGAGGPMERSMLRLTHALAADWAELAPARPQAALAGARAASAWLASWEEMDPKQRRGLLEVCSSIIGDEPEASFRLAAGQFAAYEDTAGLEQLSDAFRLVIASQESVASDPLAFIHAEIELGTHGPLALGRVAAGLCLLWATSNQQSLDYLRDDLIEDLRYSGRFVGQDQDQLLLREIIRRMDQLRTETLPMRTSKAA